MLPDFETTVSERSEPGRVAFARLRRTSPEPEGRRQEEAAAPKARAAGIRPSSPSEERGEASARGAREHWKKPGMLLDFEKSVSERSEPGREEAAAPKARAAGIRPSSPSEERGEASARGAREHWKKPGMLPDFKTSGKQAAGF